MKKRLICLIMAIILLVSVLPCAGAAHKSELDMALEKTENYYKSNLKSPDSSSGWVMVALNGGDFYLEKSYTDTYYKAMESYVSSCGGRLSETRFTKYSLAVLGITAAGYDPRNVAGYDLTAPLSEFENVKKQGLNGPIFALIALDCGEYPCDIRDKYADYILSRQLDDGGWAFNGDVSDPDMTAMAIQALSKYIERDDVAEAVKKGISRLSSMQDKNGGYASWGVTNSESAAQTIIAMSELGIAANDERFIKNGHTVLDNLLSYQNPDGSFCHEKGKGTDGIATEQAFIAMAAAKRTQDGLKGIYSMGDKYVKPIFSDIKYHWARKGIEYACNHSLFNGTSDTEFSPETPMSRAMLVTVLWRLDGKERVSSSADFKDVKSGAYYENAVMWANENGIVNGYGGGCFGTNDHVTRQQLAAILYRYAEYKGMDISAYSDISAFSDFSSVAVWAVNAMSWANAEGLITGVSSDTLSPDGSATRAQVAVIFMRFIEGTK